MKHPTNVRAVLKAANLSEGSELEKDQLQRAKDAAEQHKMMAAGELKGQPLKGVALANFILKGGKGAGGKTAGGRGGRVPGKMSMTEAAKKILGRSKKPLHAHEIARRAIAQKLIETKGKTPEQTMAARLAVGTRKGEFERTAPNTFTLPAKKTAGKKPRRAKATA